MTAAHQQQFISLKDVRVARRRRPLNASEVMGRTIQWAAFEPRVTQLGGEASQTESPRAFSCLCVHPLTAPVKVFTHTSAARGDASSGPIGRGVDEDAEIIRSVIL